MPAHGRIVNECGAQCSGRDESMTRATSRSQMGLHRPANGTRMSSQTAQRTVGKRVSRNDLSLPGRVAQKRRRSSRRGQVIDATDGRWISYLVPTEANRLANPAKDVIMTGGSLERDPGSERSSAW